MENFELTFKYRLTPLNDKGFANSGVQYRSRVNQPSADGPVISGYQADCEAGPTYTGILYEERGRGILAKRGEKTVVKPDPTDPNKAQVEVVGKVGNADAIQASIDPKGWTEYRVIAKGNHLQQFINGQADGRRDRRAALKAADRRGARPAAARRPADEGGIQGLGAEGAEVTTRGSLFQLMNTPPLLCFARPLPSRHLRRRRRPIRRLSS